MLKAVAMAEKWSAGWAYDGRKSLHAPGMFLRQGESEFRVRPLPDYTQQSRFRFEEDGVLLGQGRS